MDILTHTSSAAPGVWRCLDFPMRCSTISAGSAIVALEDGPTLQMADGDFVLIARGEPHVLCSGLGVKPFPLLDLDRLPAHLGLRGSPLSKECHKHLKRKQRA
jgi:hypothetical protein